jgi:hypothetical protein
MVRAESYTMPNFASSLLPSELLAHFRKRFSCPGTSSRPVDARGRVALRSADSTGVRNDFDSRWIAGIAPGLIGASAVTRMMAIFLGGVRPWDRFAFDAVSTLLAAVALLACSSPRRTRHASGCSGPRHR